MKKRNFRARTEDYNNELRKLGILKPVEEIAEDFNNLSKPQIIQRLTELEVSTTSSMKKDELIKLLEETLKQKELEKQSSVAQIQIQETKDKTENGTENGTENSTETEQDEELEEIEEIEVDD